jgi:hypothetical protein
VGLCVNICTRWQKKNDDVAPRQQKPPQNTATPAKTTSETAEGVKLDGFNSS